MTSEKKDLSTSGVCEIIKSCAEYQVSSLQWGDLKISFGHHTKREGNSPHPAETAPALTPQQLVDRDQEDLESEEAKLMADKVANLIVEDPVKYEELIQDGELEDESDDNESTGD